MISGGYIPSAEVFEHGVSGAPGGVGEWVSAFSFKQFGWVLPGDSSSEHGITRTIVTCPTLCLATFLFLAASKRTHLN